MKTHSPPGSTPRSGFSLIELILAVTVMVVLMGAAVPVATKFFTYQLRSETLAELQELQEAAAAHFHDTNTLPTGVADLIVDPGTPGWTGPYLPGVVTDQLSGLSGYEVDAWSRPYDVSASGDVLTLTSMGEDATLGTEADLALDLDVTPIRRRKTLERLEVLNQAVRAYNTLYLATDPLPANWPAAYLKLTSSGLLPTSSDYETDAWGVAFVEDPVGATPVVAVSSPSLQ